MMRNRRFFLCKTTCDPAPLFGHVAKDCQLLRVTGVPKWDQPMQNGRNPEAMFGVPRAAY